MSTPLARVLRVPLTISIVFAALVALVPIAMSLYAPYLVRPGITCVRIGPPVSSNGPFPLGMCRSLADLYHLPFTGLFVDAMFRSLALLVGAAVLALLVGSLLGIATALLRRRAFAAAAVMAMTTIVSAVPAFFVAYFLQIVVILVGATPEGDKLLPVYGFGYDGHLVLPLLSVAIPAIAYTAQLTATRTVEVLDADFVTAARAKGLREGWILAAHVFPHVRPVMLEALGSGLRVSVASLPIIEFLFVWRGIGQLALEAVGVHDAAGLLFCGLVLATLFALLSAVADLSRPRALYRAVG
jgi:ABC-type dipeptide/oligopeptide/nickel transport system permease component